MNVVLREVYRWRNVQKWQIIKFAKYGIWITHDYGTYAWSSITCFELCTSDSEFLASKNTEIKKINYKQTRNFLFFIPKQLENSR